jgi:hypothetical protein
MKMIPIFQTCRKAGNHFFDLPKVVAPKSRTEYFCKHSLLLLYLMLTARAMKNELGALQSAVTVLMLDGFKWLLDPKNQTV